MVRSSRGGKKRGKINRANDVFLFGNLFQTGYFRYRNEYGDGARGQTRTNERENVLSLLWRGVVGGGGRSGSVITCVRPRDSRICWRRQKWRQSAVRVWFLNCCFPKKKKRSKIGNGSQVRHVLNVTVRSPFYNKAVRFFLNDNISSAAVFNGRLNAYIMVGNSQISRFKKTKNKNKHRGVTIRLISYSFV